MLRGYARITDVNMGMLFQYHAAVIYSGYNNVKHRCRQRVDDMLCFMNYKDDLNILHSFSSWGESNKRVLNVPTFVPSVCFS